MDAKVIHRTSNQGTGSLDGPGGHPDPEGTPAHTHRRKVPVLVILVSGGPTPNVETRQTAPFEPSQGSAGALVSSPAPTSPWAVVLDSLLEEVAMRAFTPQGTCLQQVQT